MNRNQARREYMNEKDKKIIKIRCYEKDLIAAGKYDDATFTKVYVVSLKRVY